MVNHLVFGHLFLHSVIKKIIETKNTSKEIKTDFRNRKQKLVATDIKNMYYLKMFRLAGSQKVRQQYAFLLTSNY